jgi:curved DNA-binding protein CbpA
MAKSLYQLLNIPESANDQQIHRAFKDIERHWAKREDDSAIETLNRAREAFVILSDPNRRIAYDRKLAASRLQPTEITLPAAIDRSNQSGRWLQRMAIVLLLLFPIASWIYHNTQQTKQQAELERSQNDKSIAAAEFLKSQQEQVLRENQQINAHYQDEQEAKRAEIELRLRQQQLDDARMLSEQQLQNQSRSLDLMEKRLNTDARDQEQNIAERQAELQYQKPAMAMALQEQQDQHLALQRQRSLKQHDENIASINSLRAARLKAYDRDHGNGGISTSNPAVDP